MAPRLKWCRHGWMRCWEINFDVVPANAGTHGMTQPPRYWVYIMASQIRGTLYIGVTGRLVQRIAEHREGLLPGFTRDYRVKRLVYLEGYDDPETAVRREKAMKKWRRAWKIEAIEKMNPEWRDLWFDLNR